MVLNILHLEDSVKDAELIRSMLEDDGFECRITRVETREDFVCELERGTFDLIVADYNLPSFDGISALRIAREKVPDYPFILISGTVGEDKAVEALKLGATDYLLKQNLLRLGAAVRNALQHAEETRMRKQAEEALSMSEERFKKAFDHAAIGKGLVSIQGRWLAVNQSLCRMLGYMEEDLLQKTFQEITFPDDLEVDLRFVQEMLNGRRDSYQMEKRYVQKQGAVVWASLSVSLVKDKDGSPLYFISEIEDITERKQAVETLQKRQAYLTAIIENQPGLTWLKDAEGRFLEVNHAFAVSCGRQTPEEVVGKTDLDVWPRELAEKYRTDDAKVIQAKRSFMVEEIVQKQGEAIWFETYKTPVVDVHGNVLGTTGYAHDITERKLAEAQLRQSEEQFRLITENATDLIAVLDLEGRRVYNSPSYKTILGDPASLRGTDSFQEIHPDDRAKIRATFLETVRTGVGKRAEFRFLLPDGSIRFIESQGSVIRDQRGNVSQVVVVSRDVTEKKKLEAQYLRAQRMESLGTLAGGIAHDLNNVLAPILLSIDVLKRRFSDAESLKMLTTIESSAFRGRDIIKQVLTFARGIEGERSLVQLRHLISEMGKIMGETFPKSVECMCETPKNLWLLNADPTQVHQIMMNLCVNARDAMPHGGRLKLSAENVVIDEHYAGMNINAKVGRYVVIKVEDTGHGIPPEYLEKIFEPFFTTKEVGKGTGLGLATAHSIVESHGGFINVYSEPGKGTEFKVYLPAVEGTAVEATEQRKESLPMGEGELILVVDDEISILEITRQTLESFGYRVIVAKDGTEAVALYAQNRDNVSAVLTDLMMPVMDGASTIRVLQKMNPAVKVIAASGMASDGSELKNVGRGVQAFLHKPYRAELLLKTLRDVLKRG